MTEELQLNPSEYFQLIKNKKNAITDDDLKRIYDNCLELLNKYKITGQTKAMRKLIFHLETIEKEREIVKAGINTIRCGNDGVVKERMAKKRSTKQRTPWKLI